MSVTEKTIAPDALIDGLSERIDRVVEFNGCGFWRTCTGCYESEDGYPNGHYPNSLVLACTLGAGCSECGGLGAVWDGIDYEEMLRDTVREDKLIAAAKGLLISEYAKNYILISPFKELAAAVREAEGLG